MEPKRRRRVDSSGRRHNRAGFITITVTPQGQHAIKCFIKSAKAGEIPEQWVTDHLVESFEKILAGVPAAKALGLLAGQGRKRTRETDLRDQKIAAEVEYEYEQLGRGFLDVAVSNVQKRYSGLSDLRIKNIYKEDQRRRRSIAEALARPTKK